MKGTEEGGRAGRAARVASELKHADMDNLTPVQALDLLRKLKAEL